MIHQTDNFKDPEDEKVLLEAILKLNEIKSPVHLLNRVKEYAPEWIVSTATQAGCNLAPINRQWAYTCVKLNVKPQSILLVKNTFIETPNIEHRNLIKSMCDNLTRVGYLVRDALHFDLCAGCKELIPSKYVMEHNNHVFSDKCTNCSGLKKN